MKVQCNSVEIFRNSELSEFCHLRGMSDAKCCLCVKAIMMAVRFSFVIKGIKETLEWFQ